MGLIGMAFGLGFIFGPALGGISLAGFTVGITAAFGVAAAPPEQAAIKKLANRSVTNSFRFMIVESSVNILNRII